VGKNLDTNAKLAAVQVLERIAPDEGFAYLHLTTAGAMWTDGGVNDAGLALVNASVAPASGDPDGVPDGILAREILRSCRDVSEAIAFAARYSPMTLGENVVVADDDGRSAVIEKLPARQAVREGATAIVACNHVATAGLAGLLSRTDSIRANSERRLAHLEDAVARRLEWSVADVTAILGDHEGGICQHGADGLTTVASLVASPRGRRMWVAGGPPCEAGYEEAALDAGPGGRAAKDWRATAAMVKPRGGRDGT
jgi:isopenicillin-N N-acyltransferase-like protein